MVPFADGEELAKNSGAEQCIELLSAELWQRLRKLAKCASKKFAAIAYVTDDTNVLKSRE